jgi:predicted metalloprotease with PDZ domain
VRTLLAAGVLALSFSSAAAAAPTFKGAIALDVTATDVERQIFAIHESFPVQRPGPLTLLYPQWEVGSHAPTASVAELAGLVLQVDGRPLAWRRDPKNPHAFQVVVPPGAKTLDIALQFLGPQRAPLITPDRVSLPWHRLLLYPAGWSVAAIPVTASITLPAGLSLAGVLDVAAQDGARHVLKTMPLSALVDAPAYAARQRRVIPLAAPSGKPVLLDIVATDAGQMAVPLAEIEKMRALVEETGLTFGPPPFQRYHALAILDDETAGGGIEHMEESENFLPADYFTALEGQLPNRDLFAHEYVHAWNGRYRIPADLQAADYNTPVQGSLLWVYEGQTEFWGRILAARAGQRSVAQTLDRLAIDAARVANRPARAWKPLRDSTNDPLYMSGHPVAWRDWQRREDYYFEGVLLWLDIDARLRALSGERVGLDDFARRFFDTRCDPAPAPYTMRDVVRTLDGLAHADWQAILDRHLDTRDDADALAGLARSGWRLVYRDTPSTGWTQEEGADGVLDLDYAIGAQVRPNGVLRSVAWDGPAFKAGLAPGAKLVKVGAEPFTPERLRLGVVNAAHTPLMVEVEAQGRRRTVKLDYHGTLRYPWLERIPGSIDRLTPLLAPRRRLP